MDDDAGRFLKIFTSCREEIEIDEFDSSSPTFSTKKILARIAVTLVLVRSLRKLFTSLNVSSLVIWTSAYACKRKLPLTVSQHRDLHGGWKSRTSLNFSSNASFTYKRQAREDMYKTVLSTSMMKEHCKDLDYTLSDAE